MYSYCKHCMYCAVHTHMYVLGIYVCSVRMNVLADKYQPTVHTVCVRLENDSMHPSGCDL